MVALATIALVTTAPLMSPPAMAQAAGCRIQIGEAELLYAEGAYERAIAVLDAAISGGACSDADLFEAYVLKGRASASIEPQAFYAAQRAFCLALCIRPDFTPDATFPSHETAVFDRARDERPCDCTAASAKGEGGTPWYSPKSWVLWAGVGAAALVGVVAASGGGDDDGGGGVVVPPGTLPDFPEHPEDP
jgi:hypothetical protein